MKNICQVELMQRTVRVKVCSTCQLCPQGKQQLGPEVLRPCESSCCIMSNLLKLYDMAGNVGASSQYEDAILEQVCRTCEASPTAGDYCTRRFTRTCPLSVHGMEALGALEPLVAMPVA